ncbi:hypothetical protein [Vibrio caribbeanicus]|uniref:Acyl-CoA dehydrogenase/oxidase C-terminal domain-containing protein n=1 Tax=Vibrio caribbeanicus ATCC BAA-2122 TaxID=796620 RepID=E3BLC6_9VIBR|nr:hypothetical protein [Vibrio caribbeanicus]EFP96138.1 hypothetical protein VIBC2010_06015 [Vibrio caribbeanicus ATCC BAA-2122]
MNSFFEATLEDSFKALYSNDFFQTDVNDRMRNILSEDSLIFHKPKSLGGFELGDKHRRILVNQFARKAPCLTELDKLRLIDLLSYCPHKDLRFDLDAITPIILDNWHHSDVTIIRDTQGFRLDGVIGRVQMISQPICVAFFYEKSVYLYKTNADNFITEGQEANPAGLVGDLLSVKGLFLDDSQLVTKAELNEANYYKLMRQHRMDLMSFSLGYCHTLLSLCNKRLTEKKQFGKHLYEHQYLRLNYASLLARYTVIERGYHGSSYPVSGLDTIKSLVLDIFRTTVHINGCYGLTAESEIFEFFQKTTALSSRISKVVSDGNFNE